MKRCIWCQEIEPIVSFEKDAHTFPSSMGGKQLVENVCDDCNHFFGSTQFKRPAVETVLKEFLNISKYLLLHSLNKPPNKGRFKSIYFTVDFKKPSVKLKYQYKLKKGFQQMLGRQFRRAIYMIYLEERERILGDALDVRFNFIRQYSRYDLGDYPIYIQIPKFKVVLSSEFEFEDPKLYFTAHSKTMDEKFKVYCLHLFGHNFFIPTSKLFREIYFKPFKEYLIETDNPMGIQIRELLYAEDIDYTFRFLESR